MNKGKNARVPEPQATTGLRFKSIAQRDLIQRAAKQKDQSMNSFVRSAAEQVAREILALSEPNNAKD